MRKNDKKSVSCPVETTIAAVGGRWKVLVIHHLLEGTQRFGELTRLLGGVSARTLTRQLRELEDSGIPRIGANAVARRNAVSHSRMGWTAIR